MKNLILLACFLFIFSFDLFGQCLPGCTGVNSINISTGVDQSGNFLPINSVDPNWKLVNYPPLNLSVDANNDGIPDCWPDYNNDQTPDPPNVNIPDAIVVSLFQNTNLVNQWLNLNDCDYPSPCGLLSSHPSNAIDCNNLFSTQPWRYRRYFCVCQQSTVNITGGVRMDDQGSFNIYDIMGNLLHTINIPSNNFGSDIPLTSTLNLNSGTYYIEVEVLNSGGALMAFVINGAIASTNGQNTLINSNSACCSNNGSITVQKILETVNCNGVAENGESFGISWTFTLFDALLNPIQTQVTNSFGELTFSGLAAGTYTVLEQAQSGYSTANGWQQVTISGNGATSVTFYNCPIVIPPGETCCPELKNLVSNYDFNLGNNGFISQYQYDGFPPSLSSLIPGEYSIINSSGATAICPNWNVCSTNNNFLAVNGETGNSGQKLVWEQTINGILANKEYKFCAKFKNLPQCCFDVKPKVNIKFSISGHDIIGEIINENITDPCAWKQIEQHLNFSSSPGYVTIQIWLDETGLGDGNDLAIDDIAFMELSPVPSSYTLFAYDQPVNLGGNFYSINFTAPALPTDCGCFWEVCILDANDICDPNTIVYNDQLWWSSLPDYCTSFNFPGYVGSNFLGVLSNPGEFDITKTYRITRGAYCRCEGFKQISIDIFEKNGRIIIRDSKTKKIIKKMRIKKKKY